MPDTPHKNWMEYWNDVAKGLTNHLEKNRNLQAEKFIASSLGLFSYITEDTPKKVSKNVEIVKHLYPLLIELHDILRATLVTQNQLLTATSAFNLRSAFEISSNLAFIYQHKNPKEMCERLSEFFRYEQIVGAKTSPSLPAEPEATERAFAAKHPYWADLRPRFRAS